MRLLTLLAAGLLMASGCGETDADGDGFAVEQDCDDTNASINPGADEVCDGVDNNCDGFIDDDANVVDAPTWYLDRDVDGFGDDKVTKVTCAAPGGGWSLQGGDCDDTDEMSSPGGEEICNDRDDDCDGVVDNPSDGKGQQLWYEDADFDTYGDPAKGQLLCPQQVPPLWVRNGEDCDDADRAQYPGADEYCNGEDDDCDTVVDELDEVLDGFDSWFDNDGDGYGDPATITYVCELGEGYSDVGGDCDDDDPVVALGCACTTREGGDLVVEGLTTLQGGRYDYDNVTVKAGGTLRFRGAEPVYLFADTVTIEGTVDLAASGTTAGAGGGDGGRQPSCGRAGNAGRNSLYGGGGGGASSSGYSSDGGGGGGNADDGTPGGVGRTGSSAGKAGTAFGDETLETAFGGGGGGASGSDNGGSGGGGGGAIKIVAGEIAVSGTIDARGASGARGRTGCYYGGGGGGGGAGGSVWLHGDRVDFSGVILIAGGAGGPGQRGSYSYYMGGSGGEGSYGRVRISGADVLDRGEVDEDRPYTDSADPTCETPFEEEEE